MRTITGNTAEDWLEEDKTVAMRSELPREAPCEGVGGLSKAKELAAIPVALASSISDTIKKAAVEARRVTAEKLEAGLVSPRILPRLQSSDPRMEGSSAFDPRADIAIERADFR